MGLPLLAVAWNFHFWTCSMNSYLFMIKNQIRVSNMNEYVLSAIMSHRFWLILYESCCIFWNFKQELMELSSAEEIDKYSRMVKKYMNVKTERKFGPGRFFILISDWSNKDFDLRCISIQNSTKKSYNSPWSNFRCKNSHRYFNGFSC